MSRARVWLALQATLTLGLAVLIVMLARSVLVQVERAADEKALTLARTTVAAIQGVIRHGSDQEGRVQGILEEVARSPEVRGVAIVDASGASIISRGAPLPGPLHKAPRLVRRDGLVVVAIPFQVRSGCMARGNCQCTPGSCPCGMDERWAVPSGTYRLVLTLASAARKRIEWPVVSVAALGIVILLALFIVGVVLARSLGARERLARDMALEQQRRQSLESLGLLAAGLAHEIRNPLGAIRGFAQLLHEQATNQESARASAMMMEELDRVSERLEEFLGFARHRKTASDEVDLGAVARKVAALLGPDTEAAEIPLRVIAPDEPVTVTGEEGQIEELLLNLVLNALEASDAGCQITVEVARVAGRPLVTVIDEGHGVAPEVLPRLFEPYFSTKAKGSGLGLAISRRIAEDHRAVLTIESGEGRGAIARLEFPPDQGASQ